MPPTFVDSKHEALFGWVQGQLAAIVSGATPRGPGGASASAYWYTPSAVVRSMPLQKYFDDHRTADMPVIYFVWSGADQPEQSRTTGSVERLIEGEMVLARQSGIERRTGTATPTADMGETSGDAAFDPFATFTGPHPDTVRSRMKQDVDRALRADPSFGGVANGSLFEIKHENRNYFVYGWDAVHLMWEITYRHGRMDP